MAAPTTLASDASVPLAVAVDAGSVYFTDAMGAVMKVPWEGGSPATFASDIGPTMLAIDGSHVYWTD